MKINSFDLRSDAAENSIMQTITIAVSAILIAAGLVTAPGLINNARDNNATTDLANIAFAQEFNLANTGSYAALGTPADASTVDSIYGNTKEVIADGGSGPKITVSGGTWSSVEFVAGTSYSLVSVSQSGNVFLRTSDSGNTVNVGKVTFTGSGDAKAIDAFTPNAAGTAAGVTAVRVEAAVKN